MFNPSDGIGALQASDSIIALQSSDGIVARQSLDGIFTLQSSNHTCLNFDHSIVDPVFT
jgi:hypothetical protein